MIVKLERFRIIVFMLFYLVVTFGLALSLNEIA